MLKFSWVKGGITKLIPTANITIEQAVELIKGEVYREPVEKLRSIEDPEEKKKFKDTLDYFLFSGTFKKRLTESLIEHSNLLCIDLDPYRKSKTKEPELINPRLIEEFDQVKAEIIADPITLCCFISPSGNGYKVIFKIDGSLHAETFEQLKIYYKNTYGLTLDKGVNDIARACFVSYDPNIYFNPDSLDLKIEDSTTVKDTAGWDPLFEDAARICVMHQQGSTSLLQRKLALGYNRAGRIIDQLEAAKIVGPFEGAKARDVLIPGEYELEQHLQSLPAPNHQELTSGSESEQRAFSASEQLKLNKDLRRAIYVVEQAERMQIDLTGDYSDWQLIAFSLALFGDDGRDLWHRISKIYDGYDPKEADDKFDNAIKTGRFKNPAKFFSIAKDYGLDVKLPKTIEEAKKEKSVTEIVTDETAAEEYLAYGIYEDQGIYWVLNNNNERVPVSNFKMRILYHVQTSDEEAYRLIQIKNVFGLDKVVKMNTDDFVSVGSFKKVVARQGNFIWKGSDPDLCRLQDMLQRHERPTELIKQLGYNKRNNFFAWANGIFDCNENEFIPVDDCGIVEHYRVRDGEKQPQNYFIPAFSKMFAEKDDLYVNDKRFIFIDRNVCFEDFAKLFCEVYKEQGEIALIFYVMSLFSDIVFTVLDDRFPMLNVYGQKGTGKGTMVETMMKLFGKGQKQLMLGGASTVVGFMRKSGQYSNALVWLDEYKNNLNEKAIESLKNFYERIGYERGKKDTTFQTESTSVDSAIIVSGQEMPTKEEALFSRFIQCVMKKPSTTDEAKDKFKKLKELEAGGLSIITVYLLQFRQYFLDNFKKVYNEEERLLYKAINNNEVIPRFINNYAALVATCRLISDLESLPFNLVHFRELCKKTVLEQHYILKGSDTIGKFWSIVETLFNQDIIKEEHHFRLKNGLLYIRIQDIYQHYAEMMQKRKDSGALDEATLKNYLEHDPKSFVAREKKFFGGAQRWCFVFKYEELGIDLIRANTKEELKAKLLANNIKFEDDEDAPAPIPVPEIKAPVIPVGQQIKIAMKPKYDIGSGDTDTMVADEEEPPF